MNKVAAFALRRKNSILSMSEKMFCPPQPLRFWITPACAGKRRSDWIIRSIYWDHPRVCGEKACGRASPRGAKGSPPRMRGKGADHLRSEVCLGITPAYAGKRTTCARHLQFSRDHPRACGEKCPPGKFFFMTVGSPPRMRGKEVRMHNNFALRGITPACAGKSFA